MKPGAETRPTAAGDPVGLKHTRVMLTYVCEYNVEQNKVVTKPKQSLFLLFIIKYITQKRLMFPLFTDKKAFSDPVYCFLLCSYGSTSVSYPVGKQAGSVAGCMPGWPWSWTVPEQTPPGAPCAVWAPGDARARAGVRVWTSGLVGWH